MMMVVGVVMMVMMMIRLDTEHRYLTSMRCH